MRILIFSPYPSGKISGNGVTLHRLQKNLTRRGHRVQVAVPVARMIDEAISSFRPDLVHGYHAYKTGSFLSRISVPWVVSVAGTDLSQDVTIAERHSILQMVFAKARLILAASHSLAASAAEHFPESQGKIRRISKGVQVGSAPFDAGVGEKEELVFLPGGLRPVKNQQSIWEGVDQLARNRPLLRLLLAGPVLDKEYAVRVLQGVALRPWARHIESIPHESIGSLYRQARIVLNCSLAEGLSNTVMEAMACGGGVLASDIPGNRELIQDGKTGYLYGTLPGFLEKAETLLRGAGDLRKAAAAYAEEQFSPMKETEDLLRVYAEALRMEE